MDSPTSLLFLGWLIRKTTTTLLLSTSWKSLILSKGVLDRLEGQSLDIDYSLEFLSPFHCGAGEGKGLFDRLVRRDQGLLVVPGSTVKGLTRKL